MMKVLLVLAALCAIAVAQQPTVQQNLALFDQNGGILTVYGTGFVQRNLGQFNYRLFAGAGPCVAGCQFFCHYKTMTINAAGTITQCEVPYIPDGHLGVVGSNYITLTVTNANGASGPAVTVATIRPVPTTITASTSNAIPIWTTGITITGSGFPSQDSIFRYDPALAAPVYTLTLTDNVPASTTTIDLLASRSGLVAAPMAFWDRGAVGTLAAPQRPAAGRVTCRWGRSQIDCYYIRQGAAWAINNNVNGLFASLTITSAFSAAATAPQSTDTVGPVQIGVLVANVAPVMTPIAIVAPFNPATFITATDPIITMTATNLLQFPVQNSNIFVPAANGANQDLRCDTVSVTATTLSCQLTTRPVAYRTAITAVTLAANQITGYIASAGLPFTTPAAQTPVALVNSAGAATAINSPFKFPLNPATLLPDPTLPAINNYITPDDQPVQQDARLLTIRSGSASFPVLDYPDLFSYQNPAVAAANNPLNVNFRITITGWHTAAFTCHPIFPDQVEPNTVAVPSTLATLIPGAAQGTVTTDLCTIVSLSPTQAVLRLPGPLPPGTPTSSPVGTIISAQVIVAADHQATNSAGTVVPLPLFAATPVGVMAPGAGVGGDPHFFGFLGEKYEFAGEAGRVYNLLSDEGIQLNAEIGYWHWNRGKETIIRKLALKTDNHRVLIDAGGNHLGTEGFSISVDGASIAPSRIRQTYLGSEGWLRWYPLTQDDKFRLPLWERHQGVALIEIVLNDYKFEVLAVEEGKDKDGVWHKQPSRFLDFMAGMLTERRPHGLFGQSAHLRANQRSVSDFTIEGEGADYEVSGLFGDDFAFNKFVAKK